MSKRAAVDPNRLLEDLKSAGKRLDAHPEVAIVGKETYFPLSLVARMARSLKGRSLEGRKDDVRAIMDGYAREGKVDKAYVLKMNFPIPEVLVDIESEPAYRANFNVVPVLYR